VLGLCLMRTVRTEQAEHHTKRARALNERVGHLYGIAKSVLLEAEILRTRALPQKALDLTLDAIKLHEDIKDVHGVVLSRMHASWCCTELRQAKQASQHLEIARRLIETHELKVLRPQHLTLMGYIHELTENFEDAVSYYDDALQLAESIEHLEASATAAVNLAKLHLFFNDVRAAEMESPLALERAERLGHAFGRMGALAVQVVIARVQRNLDALSSSLRRLRVLNENATDIDLHIPARMAHLARAMANAQTAERAFPSILAVVDILRSLDADDLADELARDILKVPKE